MAGIKSLVCLAFTGSIGMTFLILACALHSKWWPFFDIIFYILAPLPTLMARRYSQPGGSSNSCMETAIFLTMGIIVSSFALPIVMARVAAIEFFQIYSLVIILQYSLKCTRYNILHISVKNSLMIKVKLNSFEIFKI